MRKPPLHISIFLLALNIASFAAWWLVNPKFEFAHPVAFFLLLIIPLLSLHYLFFHSDRHSPMKFGVSKSLRHSGASFIPYVWHGMFFLRCAAIWLLATAAARPQSKDEFESTNIEGIDIVLSLDISESMLAKDLSPDRLDVAKVRALEFIDGRPDDRIGLVVFQGEAYTQVPLTTDHRVLKNAILDLKPGLLEPGTAVGMGLATALNRIKDSEAVSKIVILLTDGEDNVGQVRPMDAAGIAKTFGIRVYTIGVGKKGKVLMPVRKYPNGQYEFDWIENHIDEESLQQIADLTGGRYFSAASSEKLGDAYREIDELEKTKFEVTQYSKRQEEFFIFLLPAVIILLIEIFSRVTLIRTTP